MTVYILCAILHTRYGLHSRAPIEKTRISILTGTVRAYSSLAELASDVRV